MMNKQLAFVKSGLGLALCFLLVGAGNTPPLYAANTEVSVNQQARMYITIEKYTIFQLKSIPVLIVCEDKKSYLNAG